MWKENLWKGLFYTSMTLGLKWAYWSWLLPDKWARRCEDFPDTVTHLLCKCWVLQEQAGGSCKYDWDSFFLVHIQNGKCHKKSLYDETSWKMEICLSYLRPVSALIWKPLFYQIGFNPLRVLRKRNKALRMIRKLLKKGDLQWTTVRTHLFDNFYCHCCLFLLWFDVLSVIFFLISSATCSKWFPKLCPFTLLI